MAVTWRIYTAMFVALMGPLQYGIGLTLLSTMLEALSDDLGFDQNVGGAVASAALFLGAALGSLFSGPFERQSGKYVQLRIGFVFSLGCALSASASSHRICWGGFLSGCVPIMLLSGRLLAGFAAGLARVVTPKYLAEISPSQLRGTIGALSQLCIGGGTFLGTLLGLPYALDAAYQPGLPWWRFMFLLAATPGIAQCLLTGFTFPLHTASAAELRHSFRAGSSDDTAPNLPLLQPLLQLDSEEGMSAIDVDSRGVLNAPSWRVWFSSCLSRLHLLMEPRYRLSVVLGIGVPFTSQVVGIGFMAGYSTTVFKDAGLKNAVAGSLLFGFGNFIFSAIPIFFFDTYGRTTMAFLSFGGMSMSYCCLALSDLARDSVSGPFSVLFILILVLSFAAGCGALTVSYGPEVVPPEISGLVLGIGQSISILVAFVLVLVLPSLLDHVGGFCTFLLLSSFSFMSLVFLKRFMIETKGKDLQEISLALSREATRLDA